jgi:hypothetical protein
MPEKAGGTGRPRTNNDPGTSGDVGKTARSDPRRFDSLCCFANIIEFAYPEFRDPLCERAL